MTHSVLLSKKSFANPQNQPHSIFLVVIIDVPALVVNSGNLRVAIFSIQVPEAKSIFLTFLFRAPDTYKFVTNVTVLHVFLITDFISIPTDRSTFSLCHPLYV